MKRKQWRAKTHNKVVNTYTATQQSCQYLHCHLHVLLAGDDDQPRRAKAHSKAHTVHSVVKHPCVCVSCTFWRRQSSHEGSVKSQHNKSRQNKNGIELAFASAKKKRRRKHDGRKAKSSTNTILSVNVKYVWAIIFTPQRVLHSGPKR